MTAGLTDQPAALAQLVLEGFLEQQQRFNRLTLGARERFQRGDWDAVQRAARLRITQYGDQVDETLHRVEAQLGGDADPRTVWQQARLIYADIAASRADYELTETWFNSVYCRQLGHAAIDPEAMFVDTAAPPGWPHMKVTVHRTYRSESGVEPLLNKLLRDYDQGLPWEDLGRDVQRILDAMAPRRRAELALPSQSHIDVLRSVFYRNKGAYLIGRMVTPEQVQPFALPLQQNDDGALYVDTLIIDPDDLSILFSFTRSYFMVRCAGALGHGRLPEGAAACEGALAELYNAIGFYRHGKTEFYRDFRAT
jgi:isocitrate dehydrogenase kinase/phosphatase